MDENNASEFWVLAKIDEKTAQKKHKHKIEDVSGISDIVKPLDEKLNDILKNKKAKLFSMYNSSSI